MITNGTDNHHKQGEAIAARIREKLGPIYLVSYKGDRKHWEITNTLIEKLIFGSLRYSDEGRWEYKANPTLDTNVRRLIDRAVEEAIASQSHSPT